MKYKNFENINRKNCNPRKYTEPLFDFLNRSAKHEVHKIRNILEEWFSNYPNSQKHELRRRLHTKKDSKFHSAFFELFLHELLLKLGCKIIIHPQIKNISTKSPDFLVENNESEKFYLEAIVTSNETEDELAIESRKKVVYDAITLHFLQEKLLILLKGNLNSLILIVLLN